jgi:type IV pilus assembly protein PilV
MPRRVANGGAVALRGMALMESLIALAVLSGALLGLLWLQVQTLAESTTSMWRSQAIQLIGDLSERVRSNPQAQARLQDFRVEWGVTVDVSVDCQTDGCDAASLARWDLARWKAAVSRQLPRGEAMVYALPDSAGAPATMLGVMIGWRAKASAISSSSSADGEPEASDAARCPQGWTCHFGHVQP